MTYPSNCPSCKADMQGDPIPEKDRHFYGATSTHYSRVIGISDGDSVGYWMCPDCGHQWDREGSAFAAQARKNIDRMK